MNYVPDMSDPVLREAISRISISVYQDVVRNWTVRTFGEDGVKHSSQYRVVEEALELGQSLGVSKEDAINLVNKVCSLPVGDVKAELGDALFTLCGVANQINCSLAEVGYSTMNMNFNKIEAIREKNKSKIKESR